MIIIGVGIVEDYLARCRGREGIELAHSHYRAWLQVVGHAQWRNAEELKKSYPKASILSDRLVAFKMNDNKYVLICQAQYVVGIFVIRFFGAHTDYEIFKQQRGVNGWPSDPNQERR
jgi:mRNA-degrading endonuclease HigB of HigAB toxin-antitoxin module